MTLTDAELKLVRRAQEREETWKWARWIVVLLGFLMIGLGSFFLAAVWQELKQEQVVLMLVAVMAPVCSFFILAGGLCAGYVAICWKGRPATRLLLRLARECGAQNQNARL
jgi:4-amino-4-deoxy-L-arabinose transferase-like glycosyltransferase